MKPSPIFIIPERNSLPIVSLSPSNPSHPWQPLICLLSIDLLICIIPVTLQLTHSLFSNKSNNLMRLNEMVQSEADSTHYLGHRTHTISVGHRTHTINVGHRTHTINVRCFYFPLSMYNYKLVSALCCHCHYQED